MIIQLQMAERRGRPRRQQGWRVQRIRHSNWARDEQRECYMVILAVAVPTVYILILINVGFYILRFYACQYLFSILA